MQSPISTPKIPEHAAPNLEAFTVAIDQALFAVIEALVKKGVLEADDLAGTLAQISRDFSPDGKTEPKGSNEAGHAVSRALERMSKAIGRMA